MTAKTPNGFVLIELVTTLVLVGFISAFVGLFLYTGVNGFLSSKRNSEAALKAQFALDRLSAELRHIESLPAAPVANTSITYRSKDLPGTRKIRYDFGTKTIFFSIDSGTEYALLEQMRFFSLLWSSADMDQLDSDSEIRAINIRFGIVDVPRDFTLSIHPRTLIPRP
jgi:prepilin-type N-terminal cleavage/methylation domain-containing protein